MINHWWYTVPNPKYPGASFRHPALFVVVKEAGRIGPTDISAEVVASVNDAYPIGRIDRRCCLRMSQCEFRDGDWYDKTSNLKVTPMAPPQNVRPADDPDRLGLHDKYTVLDKATGQPIKARGFTLLPEKDPAALGALKTYAAMCSEPRLKAQLLEWIREIEAKCAPLWRQAQNLGSMGRINAGFDKV